jgi:hypothetical protein
MTPNTTRVRPSPGLAALLMLVALARPVAVGAQTTQAIQGQAVDAPTGRPVVGAVVMLVGTSYSAYTDSLGAFTLSGMRPGSYTLRLSHIAYGEKTTAVEVRAGEVTNVRITVSSTLIVLQPLNVEAQADPADERARRLGIRDGRVTREQIAALENHNATLADVLQRNMPGVRVRRGELIVGSNICIELRTVRASGVQPTCLSPAVYLDGVPVTNPTALYSSLNVEALESLEIIPAAEAGVRFGTGALYGALLIETRRPGGHRAGELITRPTQGFDWTVEPRPHPRVRAYVFSFVGNAVGLTAGFSAARQCIRLRQPAEDAIIATCDTWPSIASAIAGLALPALGAGIGSRLGGQTPRSHGQLLPAAAGAAMTLLPGYALALTSQRGNSDAMGAASVVLLALGAPLATTIADRLFRSLRN